MTSSLHQWKTTGNYGDTEENHTQSHSHKITGRVGRSVRPALLRRDAPAPLVLAGPGTNPLNPAHTAVVSHAVLQIFVLLLQVLTLSFSSWLFRSSSTFFARSFVWRSLIFFLFFFFCFIVMVAVTNLMLKLCNHYLRLLLPAWMMMMIGWGRDCPVGYSFFFASSAVCVLHCLSLRNYRLHWTGTGTKGEKK